MIIVKNLVPEIYYSKSRDFQAIGRVFEVLYNYAKTNADILLNVDENIKMLELLAKTLGFNTKHNYNTEDLIALCSTFITIIRNKGSKESVEMAIRAMLKAQHIEKEFYVEDAYESIYEEGQVVGRRRLYQLNIHIPKELDDLILLEDLFDYILATGFTYRFISIVESKNPYKTDVAVSSKETTLKFKSNDTSEVGIVTNVTDGKPVNIIKPTADTQQGEIEHLGLTYSGVVFRPVLITDLSNDNSD